LVVGNDPGVSALLGNGDGTFQNPRRYDTGCGTVISVAVGDFNGDGIPDLVETVYGDFGSCVSVLLGYGDGNFYQIWHVYPFVQPGSVVVGDFNADGALDLAWANANSAVSVLLGNGDGSFQAAQDFGAGINPIFVAVGDFNQDGWPDLAVANHGGPNGTVSVLLGNGDGTFQAAQGFRAGSFPRSVAVGDFNGDGAPDLAVTNAGSNDISVLLGNGDGTFQDPQRLGAGTFPYSVAVGDFNGDGAPDLAVANAGSNDISVLLGNGDGTFQAAHNFDVNNPELLAVGDFNGDGLPDLALTVYVAVSVLINNTPRR
jgi:hypothetical protein